MKIKKQYLILSGIIAVLLIYLILGGSRSKMSYEVPKLESLNEQDITKLEIILSDRTVILGGQGESWNIEPQDYPADPVKVEDMLETVSNLTLTELASEQQDYQRYDLDQDSRITVKAYQDEKIVREFDIGKIPSTYRHTFIRMADDTRVYYARESFRSRFEVEIKDLRDKKVMSFDKNAISEIQLKQEDSTWTFAKKMIPVPTPEEKTPAEKEETEAEAEAETEVETEVETAQEPQEQEAWVTADGKTGDKTNLDTILNELSDLRCDDFIEGKTEADYPSPIYTVMLKGNKDYTLQIYAKEEKEEGGEDEGSSQDEKYPAVSSESPYPFLLSTYRAERIMKKAEDLFPQQDERP
jgi:hypothetical protein